MDGGNRAWEGDRRQMLGVIAQRPSDIRDAVSQCQRFDAGKFQSVFANEGDAIWNCQRGQISAIAEGRWPNRGQSFRQRDRSDARILERFLADARYGACQRNAATSVAFDDDQVIDDERKRLSRQPIRTQEGVIADIKHGCRNTHCIEFIAICERIATDGLKIGGTAQVHRRQEGATTECPFANRHQRAWSGDRNNRTSPQQWDDIYFTLQDRSHSQDFEYGAVLTDLYLPEVPHGMEFSGWETYYSVELNQSLPFTITTMPGGTILVFGEITLIPDEEE